MFAGILGCGEATTPTATDAQPTGATGDMMAVSINVPGMTWGGCVSAVRTSLEEIGATDIDASNSTNPPSASFKVSADMDIDAKLNELAETNSKFKDWEKQ